MTTPENIRSYILNGLQCDQVEVSGDGHHFEALIVSPSFAGKNRVQRHQLVYQALGERMREEIHALSMRTLTPEEGALSQWLTHWPTADQLAMTDQRPPTDQTAND